MTIDPKMVDENHARLMQRRSNFDSSWSEIARLVYPAMDRFYGGGMSGSRMWRDRPVEAYAHDPYAAGALEDGVSVFEGFVMPRGQRWQKLSIDDEPLMARVENAQWLEQVEIRLFRLRNDPESGFANAVHESAMSLFAFGAQSTWPEVRRNAQGWPAGLSYQAEFIGDIYIERDAEGRPMRIHKVFELTAEQAERKWGDACPPEVRKALSGMHPNRQAPFVFIHIIEPNRDIVPGRMDHRGKPWCGGYWSVTDKVLFQEGGYWTLPRIVSTYASAAGSTWGMGPTQKVLPLIRMGQEITLDRVLGAEMRLKPPLLAQDDALDSAVISLRAFGITYGGLDERGNPMLKEFLTQADATDAKDLTMEARALIDRAYFRDLLQLNRELKSHVSAARTAEEVAEKGLLLAPLSRQEQQWLSPMTERELQLMGEIGWLDDMPDEIREYLADGGGMGIKYDNGLSAMQEAGKSAAYLNVASQVGALAQFDPSVVEDFRREMPMAKVIPALARIAGVPASMMATDDEKSAFDEQKAMAARQEALLKVAPVVSDLAQQAGQLALPAPV